MAISHDMTHIAQTSLLDTLRVYEIPEGISLEFRLAGPVVRACAWAIDASLRVLLYLVVSIVLSFFGGVGMALMLIGLFLIEWFYPVVFELYSGATPGKKAMGIWVIQDNGSPVTPNTSIIRNLLRAVDFLPILYAIGLLSMLLDREFKRLGDLAAGTLVVYRDQPQKLVLSSIKHLAKPPYELTQEEQKAVLAFAERGELLSSARRIELAEILSGLSGIKGQEMVDELYAYANWITKGHTYASGTHDVSSSLQDRS